MTKADHIRLLLKQEDAGDGTAAIAKIVGCDPTYVRAVRSRDAARTHEEWCTRTRSTFANPVTRAASAAHTCATYAARKRGLSDEEALALGREAYARVKREAAAHG